MHYKQFQKFVHSVLTEDDISARTFCYGHTIVESAAGKFFIDNVLTDFVSLEEALQSIKQQKLQEDIQKDIQQEQYTEMSDNKIADIIRKHHNVQVTDTLIESYVELASSKIFTTDAVAQDIRSSNKLDRIIENRIDYKLNDGSVIVITNESQQRINNILKDKQDVIDYMRESKDNFLTVLNLLED